MKIRSPRKVKQQRRVLLLALYLLKHEFGDPRPLKRKVLRTIVNLHLMHVPEGDFQLRSTRESIWENDLAWKREELKELGLVKMPERGVWQITEHGEKNIRIWAHRIKNLTDARFDWVADFKAHSNPDAEYDDELHCEYYITEETVRWALKIAEETGIAPSQHAQPQ